MCGRYTLSKPEELVAALEAETVGTLEARYNIAPTQEVPVVRTRRDTGGRVVMNLRWGLIPFWAKDASIGNRMINARAETVAAKPAFREAVRRRRCGVLADGFYEWQRAPDGKQPFHIYRLDRAPFLIAGLWERWRGPDGRIDSFTIVTTAANQRLRSLHDRMPVILPHDGWGRWLDPAIEDPEALRDLLVPAAEEDLAFNPVGRQVNRPDHDAPDCIAPLTA